MKARDVMVSPGTRRRRSRHLALRGTRRAIGAREEWIGDLQQHLGCAMACTPPSCAPRRPGTIRGCVCWRPTAGSAARIVLRGLASLGGDSVTKPKCIY
jgi:hypothetical protein